MSRSQLAALLSQINTLQADSLETRKDLIRESFAAMDYDTTDAGLTGCGSANNHDGGCRDSTPIEPDYYDWH